jgi:hypothetical protein
MLYVNINYKLLPLVLSYLTIHTQLHRLGIVQYERDSENVHKN